MKKVTLIIMIIIALTMMTVEAFGQQPQELTEVQKAMISTNEATILMELQQQRNNLAVRLAIINNSVAETQTQFIIDNNLTLARNGFPQFQRILPLPETTTADTTAIPSKNAAKEKNKKK